jgi:pSer/pThr/pTyr-binding forkhead associated (FHA) protein
MRRTQVQTSRSKTVVKIGKLQSADLRLEDDKVSRMHAVIEVQGDDLSGYWVHAIDLGSEAGFYVNDQRRKAIKVRLVSGDRLHISPFTVIVYFDGAPETPLVAPHEKQAARYPEHEKMNALLGKRDAVARFLEWMETTGYVICIAQRVGGYRDSTATYEPVRKTAEEWLADHFGIDLQKIAAEKAAMLAARKA